MSLARILSSEALPLMPTEVRDGVYSKAAIDKYLRDLHNYLRRLTGLFTADNLVTEVNNGGLGGEQTWDTEPWQKAYTTVGTSATWPTLTATSTKPTGQNVYTTKGSRVLLAGLCDVAGGCQVRVVGWRRINTVYYPESILVITPSGDAGVTPDGTEIASTLTVFPQTHTVAAGNTSRFVYTFAAGAASFGIVAVEHNGVELVQVDAKTITTGTKVNALTSFA